MRILHVVHQYPPDFIAGTELYTQALVRHQVKSGNETAVFVPAPEGNGQPVVEDGVRVYRAGIGQRSSWQTFAHTFQQHELARTFLSVIAQEQPDIIHVQHLMGLPFAIMNAVIAAHIPYVITLHDYWYGCANGQLITNTDGAICAGPDQFHLNCGRCAIARAGLNKLMWLSPLVAPLLAYRNNHLRPILAHAARVIAPTEFVCQTYRQMELFDDNFVVIQHGIEIPHNKIARILQEKKKPKRSSPGLRIGYIGSIAPQKGVHILIEAVNQLPVNDVTLTLYGNLNIFPEYTSHLRHLARHPGIHFAGRISRSDVWAKLAACDVVVVPTLWYEASPLVIDELFTVRTPIVASAIGSLPEKIRDGVDGLLFPPGDINTLTHILTQLVDDHEHIDQLRQNIRPVRTAAEHAQEISDLYTAIVYT